MKNNLIIIAILSVTLFACKSKKNVSSTTALTNYNDSLSYALGVNVANSIKQQGFDKINTNVFNVGMESVYKNDSLIISELATREIIKAHSIKQAAEKSQFKAAENKAFFVKNGAREGIITLPSGLQYEIIKAGTGPKPKATDKVTTHYTGKLLDGKVFDSSVQRGEPATFPVNGVIKGWVEALQLMPLGSKWRLYIPSDLAYGERGAGQSIGPNEALIFDIELLKIN